jgi:CHASE2 domain-containing sensor protein
LGNIGKENRAGIAYLVSLINQNNPKVVGVDSFFKSPKDSIGDLLLEEAFAGVKNLILANKNDYKSDPVEGEDKNLLFDTIVYSLPRFTKYGKSASVNFITAAADQEDLKMCRTFAPKEIVNY